MGVVLKRKHAVLRTHAERLAPSFPSAREAPCPAAGSRAAAAKTAVASAAGIAASAALVDGSGAAAVGVFVTALALTAALQARLGDVPPRCPRLVLLLLLLLLPPPRPWWWCQ